MSLLDNLISYWKCDENAGATSLVDSVGGNNLSKNGSATFGVGKINNGTDLESGTSDFWSIANALQSGLGITGAFSISAWIKLETVGSSTIVGKFSDATGESYLFYVTSDGKLRLLVSVSGTDSDERFKTSSGSLSTGVWVHVVATFDPSASMKLYINGTEDTGTQSGSVPASFASNTQPVTVGANSGGTPRYFDGMIDEVGIWSRALSSGEVLELYNSGNGLQYPFVPPVVAPSVDTLEATDITTNSGTLNGEITDTGGENADERGFVWDSESKSAPGNVAPASSGYEDYYTDSGDFSEGVFDHGIESLDTGTIYYFRAYAHNSEGYTYGEELTIETLPAEIFRFENIPGVEYNPNDKQTIFAERLNEILDRLHDLDGLDPYEE